MPTRARKKPSGTPRKRRGVKLRPTELGPRELSLVAVDPAGALPGDRADLQALAHAIAADGGSVLAAYREPLGGHALLFAALPVERVIPTPFQRDLSDAHVRKLTHAMDKTRRFLDPIIVVHQPQAAARIEPQARYFTPNGYHRLTALKELGAKSVLALVVPETAVAYQILALNIEKAHNLRERAIGVRRMMRDLTGLHAATGELDDEDREAAAEGESDATAPVGPAAAPRASEETYALEFEEPALLTLGFAYEKRGRLSGGAYHPILRKVDGWIPGPLRRAIPERERRAAVVLDFDEAVTEAVNRLKARGLTSPYLRAFVVARVNPLRFMKGGAPPFDELFATMTRRARGLDAAKIRTEDVARSGGAPEGAD